MQINISSLNQLPEAAKQLLEQFPQNRIFLFNGEMGSGKTTLIKAICKELKVTDTLSSPTYSIVNEYKTEMGNTIYHFDLYRLKTVAELFDIGFSEYLSSNNYCFIEWPELGEDFYENAVFVSIEIKDDVRVVSAK